MRQHPNIAFENCFANLSLHEAQLGEVFYLSQINSGKETGGKIFPRTVSDQKSPTPPRVERIERLKPIPIGYD